MSLIPCEFCGNDNVKTIDSRPTRNDTFIRRRKECTDCGERFSTIEIPTGEKMGKDSMIEYFTKALLELNDGKGYNLIDTFTNNELLDEIKERIDKWVNYKIK